MSGRWGDVGLGRTVGATLVGLDGHLVEIEAHVSAGLPAWSVVGLPDAAVLESRDRVRSALLATGYSPPQARVTVNLSPASVPKVGSGLDLGMCIAVLAASGQVPAQVAGVAHLGELGLDGRVRPVRGVLPLVMGLVRAGAREVVVPAANAAEACLVPEAHVTAVTSLAQALAHHRGEVLPDSGGHGDRRGHVTDVPRQRGDGPDLRDVVGQPLGRRVIEVAAAGGHHLLLHGPPGAGKTMLAARLPGLLPDLGDADALVVTAVHSIAGSAAPTGLIRRPPFEDPHHTSSVAAVVGGGAGLPRPGAISRAHAGVLLLDEAPEFARGVLEALRQPLEVGEVVIQRSRGTARLPARFLLVLTANPCPCGGQGAVACRCPAAVRRRYAARLSGPVLDRVDLQADLPPVSATRWGADGDGEASGPVAERVAAARTVATRRWAAWRVATNGAVPGRVLRSAPYRLPVGHLARLTRAVDAGILTGRGLDKCVRVAWTISDLRGGETPSRADVDEALELRTRGAA